MHLQRLIWQKFRKFWRLKLINCLMIAIYGYVKNNKIKEENIMGLFDINDEKLQALYHRALVEANYGFVNPRKYPYLDRAIMQYARENGCSYDQALILAKTGNKMF